MLSAAQQKFLTSLHVKKYRQKYRKFVVEGDKLVSELIGQQRVGVSALYALDSWLASHGEKLAAWRDKVFPVTEAELKKISALSTPNQALAVADIPEPGNPSGERPPRAFLLDGIQDPGNLGAILRVADWFGFDAVFCTPDCVDLYSPKVVQASMGAVLRVPGLEIEADALLSLWPGLPVLGAVFDGENAFTAAWPPAGLLVIGNEGRGISPALDARLTRRLTIPRAPTGRAESLNASVAAGILAAGWAASAGH